MNKRVKNKKIKKRYNYGIEFLSSYCELPKDVVIKEVSEDLWEVAKDLNEEENNLIPYLDSISIGLMWEYGTGWAGKEKINKLWGEYVAKFGIKDSGQWLLFHKITNEVVVIYGYPEKIQEEVSKLIMLRNKVKKKRIRKKYNCKIDKLLNR